MTIGKATIARLDARIVPLFLLSYNVPGSAVMRCKCVDRLERTQWLGGATGG